MDCRSCGTVNAPGRRYCRECGGRLGRLCPACSFFNGLEDRHCGGCGRRLRAAGADVEEDPRPGDAYAPAAAAELEFDAEGLGPGEVPPVPASGEQEGVSQSEIDGLFESILDEEQDQDQDQEQEGERE